MGYICLHCFQRYDNSISKLIDYELDPEGIISCPKKDCGEQVVEIDDLFIPIIELLNAKGYYTESCCSGHDEMLTNSYILFDQSVEYLPNIPNGYEFKTIYYEDECGNAIGKQIMIMRTYEEKDVYTELLKNAIETYEWAKALPEYDALFTEDTLSKLHDFQEVMRKKPKKSMTKIDKTKIYYVDFNKDNE